MTAQRRVGRSPRPRLVPAEMTLAEFLPHRERELVHQISAIRGEIGRKEADLATVRQALAMVRGEKR